MYLNLFAFFILMEYEYLFFENAYMAKERFLFLVSFALLGLVAALLFRTSGTTPAPEVNQPVTIQGEKPSVEVLIATQPFKLHDPFTPNNYAWLKIDPAKYNVTLVSRNPKNEELLKNALAAKEIPKDAIIAQSEVFWPIEGEKKPEAPKLQITPGNRAIPFEITNRVGLVQFMEPGMSIDISFVSTSDIGFGTVSLTLLKNIRILAIGQNADGVNPGTSGVSYKPGFPIEILLEMTPREAEIFFYAQSVGVLTPEFLDKERHEKQDELLDMLYSSKSSGNFRSILVTHMVRTLFPNTDITITAIPKGYIVGGKMKDPEKAAKVLEVLGKVAQDGDKAVVNLIEVEKLVIPPTVTVEDEEPIEEKSRMIPPSSGKIAVLFENSTAMELFHSLEPGSFADVIFSSNDNSGFGSVDLDLIKNIRILSIEKGENRQPYGRMPESDNITPVLTLLEMTPREAEILSYAQSAGRTYLVPSEENPSRQHIEIKDILLESRSSEEFRSTLVTYLVGKLFPRVDIKIIATAQGYVVSGRVSDPQKAEKIIEILEKLAPGNERAIVNLMEVEPQQVLLCVKVFEINKDEMARLGINWKFLFEHDGRTAAFAAVFPSPPPTDPNYFFEAYGIKMGNFTFSTLIDMLEQDDVGRVLAEPNLTTISGKTAHFFAGGEFPILIPQGGTLAGTVTVEFKKYGVMLDFTPFVDLNGLITLHVIPEISTIDKNNAVVLQGFVIPSIVSRRVDSTVKLWPGQSYVIGGLLQSEQVTKDFHLYGLNRLPIIGPLFSSKQFMTHKSELMIMVTPYLVSTDMGKICVSDNSRPTEIEMPGCTEENFVTTPWTGCRCIEDDCEVITQWEE
jgi:Flp pilus assembly protein CpaB